MINIDQIHPVTEFVRNYKEHIDRIVETKTPEVLTVNGRASCVVLDAETFQAMSEAYEHARFVAAVNEGIEDMKSGRMMSVAEARARYRESRGL